ncbi:DoxX family membrane protein [Geomonas sp. Red32]|uniref:MauE/DoxX family redox-associated membrane protein n=1 Tax=Geomonas sp. Red32 TaxID=2912856 RepID=UPI00202CFCFE|nr:MauE/DoxX family redox-associated membrane protein [Geomonas sp. Red32]MCM0080106.1 DoxX family membrane protein [Geomonas sp. Red32]
MKNVTGHLPSVARVALGGIFVYAAVLKISDPVAFAGSIAAYQILPYFASYLAAAILPFLELICGLLLICNYRVRGAAVIVGVLNLVFMAALASAIVRGLDIDCGCFKQGGAKTSPWLAMARDAVFLAMTVVVIKGRNRQEEAVLVSLPIREQ